MEQENAQALPDGGAAPTQTATPEPKDDSNAQDQGTETQAQGSGEPDKEKARQSYKERQETKRINALVEKRVQEALAKAQPKQKIEKPKRPRYSDFEDTESYEAAMDKYEDAKDQYSEQARSEKTAKEQKERSMAESKERFYAEFEAKEDAFRAKTPDYDDVVEAFAQTIRPTEKNSAVFQEIAARQDAAEILYKLAKNPEKAAEVFPDLISTKIDLLLKDITSEQKPHKPLPNPPNPESGSSGMKSEAESTGDELAKKYGII